MLAISTVAHAEGGFPRPMFSVRGAAMDTVAIEGGSIDVVVEVDLVYSLR